MTPAEARQAPFESRRVCEVLADAVGRGLVSVVVALELATRWARGEARSVDALLAEVVPQERIEELLAAHPLDAAGEAAELHTGEHPVVPPRITARGVGAIEGAAPPLPDGRLPAWRSRTPAPPAPFSIRGEARYTIAEELGVGGLGRVVRATDRIVGRVVALKTLKDGVGDGARRHRPLRGGGARHGAARAPEHRPRLRDRRVPDDGQPYYTMRVVKRRNLQDVLTSRSCAPSGRSCA